MSPLRIATFSMIAVLALTLGALFALPVYKKDFVKVEINGVSLMTEVAGSPQSRVAGLSGRESLPKLGGMLFTFERPDLYGIWMKGMKFPIDIFWIQNGRVVDLEESVLPPMDPATPESFLPVYRPDVTAKFVLETKAGFAREHDIKIGDKVNIFSKESAGLEYFIETLRQKALDGGDFRIERKLTENEFYSKVLFTYHSDGLKVSGTMNIPKSKKPGTGFPILVLAHGLIPVDIYFPGRGSKREQDFFAKNGFVTLHPDFRGLGESDPNPYPHHDFYVGYTRDVVNLLEALKKVNPVLFDLNRVGMWGHSMGGGIASRVALLAPEIKAFVLFAPISADAKDNFYELSKEEMQWLQDSYGTGEKADKIFTQVSPLNYFTEVSAPVQIHHGTEDKDVPISFSEKMFMEFKRLGKRVEFFAYPGEKHEFVDAWTMASLRALQFFDKYVKDAR